MNDPNGLIQHNGVYHLFYQHNPAAPLHRFIHWGHAVSTDLVHWRDLPIALAPQSGSADEDGCFSGSAFLDGGVPRIMYTGVRGTELTACLATATSDDLIGWHQEQDNPVIPGPPAGLKVLGFRDHAIWREDDHWCQLIGAGFKDVGGAALLYRSTDLKHWRYDGPLLAGDPGPQTWPHAGAVWECPDFFALGSHHALIVSAWDIGPLNYALCFAGEYASGRFTPRTRTIVDHGRRFYAPKTLRDQRGRRIMFGWLVEGRAIDAQLAAGWSGVMSLPRELHIDAAGRLTVRPAEELRAGRGQQMASGTPDPDSDIRGRAVEIIATLERRRHGRVGLAVLAAADGSEETTIVYDADRQRVEIDTTRSTLDLDAERALRAMPLDDDDSIRLHIFLDHSVIEVFVNDRAVVTERAYPTDVASDHIRVIGAPASYDQMTLEIWERPSIWNAA